MRQVNLSNFPGQTAKPGSFDRWVSDNLNTICNASQIDVIPNVGLSGAALSTLTNASANQIPIFTGVKTVSLLTLSAFFTGTLAPLNSAASWLAALGGTSSASLLAANNVWTGTNSYTQIGNFGNLPFVQADNFTGGAANLIGVRGTSTPLAPITDNKAVAAFQSVNNTSSGEGVTLYASLIKLNTANIDHHCIYSEVVDAAGGGSIAGGRLTASLLGGTGGNASGSTNVGLANVPFAFTVGAENQCWIYGTAQAATTTFSAAAFSCGVLSSCASSFTGGKSADAGFLINPNGYAAGKAYITGFLVPTAGASAGNDPVIDTGFRCDAKCVNAIDVSRGTYSGFSFKAPNASIDGSGNIIGVAIAATSSIKSSSPTAGVGYATGAGGTVVQATSKTTPVTLNKITGQITMSNSSLISSALPTTGIATFVFTNAEIGATDVVVACIAGGTTSLYNCNVTNVAAGSCWITVQNLSGGSLSEALVINFVVIKGANS